VKFCSVEFLTSAGIVRLVYILSLDCDRVTPGWPSCLRIPVRSGNALWAVLKVTDEVGEVQDSASGTTLSRLGRWTISYSKLPNSARQTWSLVFFILPRPDWRNINLKAFWSVTRRKRLRCKNATNAEQTQYGLTLPFQRSDRIRQT